MNYYNPRIRNNTAETYIPFLFLLLTFISVNPWTPIEIGNTTTTWMLSVLILASLYYLKLKNKIKFISHDYLSTTLYLIVATAGIIRGAFIAENYWELKTLVSTSFILLLPICVFAFASPPVIQNTLRMWIKYALIAYAVFFFWMVGVSQFYLGPVFLLAIFLPLVPKKKYQFIIVIIIFALLLYQYQDNRSQAVKAAVSLGLALTCFIRKWIPKIAIKAIHAALFIVPCVLIYLGATGEFNIFEEVYDKYKNINKIEVLVQDDEGYTWTVEADVANDSRTFIYEEVIWSAINNDYVIWGRTPARGNDTFFFYDQAKDLQGKKYVENLKNERNANELCFPNIFTWLGLVGMVAYILIFLHASILAIYKSNSFYIKMIGLYIAFNFAYGWIENVTSFDIINFIYWMAIAMALSSQFREMTDEDFKQWYAEIFKIKYKINVPDVQSI